jgi:hypothetical protein
MPSGKPAWRVPFWRQSTAESRALSWNWTANPYQGVLFPPLGPEGGGAVARCHRCGGKL